MLNELNFYKVSLELEKSILRGAKIPHGTSNPVFRIENGKYCIAAFVYTYNRRLRENKLVKRPAYWGIMNPRTGEIIECNDCHRKDFSSMELDKVCNLEQENWTAYSDDYNNQTIDIFNEVLRKYIATGEFDKSLNNEYMSRVIKMAPVDFRRLYGDLCNIK